MLLSQPAWADSKKENCDAEGGMLFDHADARRLATASLTQTLRDHRNPNTNWAIANSFQAAYVNWDTVENCHDKKRSPQTSREFDFDDYSLSGFYVLNFAWNNEFKYKNFNMK